eukprot:TRINITY_DN18316_c0_g1_i1.p1 TRINITY_DN18316_c0_g1~~TRINITY_DN18316_c0_g1_i1.p1  ORF type:complete len:552 (+),score=134.48 TRINITY_DN18316_c0_g1_i1:98-1657(+)
MGDVKLFVGGFPLHYQTADVDRLFSRYCRVLEVHMLQPRGSSGSSGCALVRVPNRAEADAGIRALDNTEVPEGHCDRMVVKVARPERDARGGPADYPPPRSAAPPPRTGRPAGGHECGYPSGGGVGCVLHFTVRDDPSQLFDAKILDKVLRKVGKPQKIQILPQGGPRSAAYAQGWAEMETPQEVDAAIEAFSGRCIMRGEMMITIVRSDKVAISVFYNDKYSWDYWEDLPKDPALSGAQPQQRQSILDAPRDHPGGGGGIPPASLPPRDLRTERGPPGPPQPGHGPVLLVGGVERGLTDASTGRPLFTSDTIETLCGAFGDVQRVKWLGDKRPGQCFVEFRRPEEAANCLEKLNHCPIYGCMLKISMSDKMCIKPPRGEDRDYTEYSQGQRWRYGPNFQMDKIVSASSGPSNCLYVSGLPPRVRDESTLLQCFRSFSPITATVFRSSRTRSMHGSEGPMEGRVEFEDIQTAVEALIALHGYTLDGHAEGGYMRVAFAQRTVSKGTLKTLHGEMHRRHV